MAEGSDLKAEALEELEKEITCNVCHGFYQRAKMLSCNHYYCFTCIEKLAESSRGRPLHCPECRKETILPPGGVAELQPAFFVERMKDFHAKMARAEGKIEAVCELCLGARTVAFCRQCADFICEDCVLSHKKLKVFEGHVVSTLEDLKRGTAAQTKTVTVMCEDHNEPVVLFCFDCDSLICRDCTLIDHRGHKFEFVKKCAPESRRALRGSLTPLQSLCAKLEVAEKAVNTEEARVDTQEEEVCQSIHQSFQQLMAILEQREAMLIRKVDSLAKEKKNALAAQKTVMQKAHSEIQLLAELVEQNVENTSNHDLMTIHTHLQGKMEEEEKRHRQLSLEPTAAADIACCLPSPDVIPSNLGSIFARPAHK